MKKIYWAERGAMAIRRAAKRAQVVVISHYHYDHYLPGETGIYKGKLLLAKNPNEYINDSQRTRAEEFFDNLCRVFGKKPLGEMVEEGERASYPNPLDELPRARKKDFGDYNERRKQLLGLGLRWFENRVRRWNGAPRIPELKFPGVEVRFPEGREFRFGRTVLRFTRPLFHGIEFSRVGWVFATVIERGKEKLIHSSDVDGPMIEDYADWIVKEDPRVLILDGPTTYMRFMLIRRNLERCIENARRIIRETTKLELLIYDHHLVRERNFRENTRQVWEEGRREGVRVLTAAEFLGKKPAVLR
ncbi:MAG: hypothetical protein QW356_02755 [Candidatus Hadarchaeales archaeon]